MSIDMKFQEDRKIIVFDLGNVLIDWNIDYLYKAIIPDGRERAAFYERTRIKQIDHERDCGKPWEELFAPVVNKYPADAERILALRDRWSETAGAVIEGSVRILESLKRQGYPLYVGSNWARDTFDLVRDRMPFLSLFDGIQISSDIFCAKPDPEFYRHLERSFGFSLQKAIFIDDKEDNIASANACGMDGILFTTPEDLEQALASRGVRAPDG